MDQLLELIEMLGEDYLPVKKTALGNRVQRLFVYLKRNGQPDEEEAALKVGVVPGSGDFRKVKHHLKLALINGVTAIDPANSRKQLDNRKTANNFVWNYATILRSKNEYVKAVVLKDIEKNLLDPAKEFDLQEALLLGCLSQLGNHDSASIRKADYLSLRYRVEAEVNYDHRLQVSLRHDTHSTFLNIKRADDSEKIEFFLEAIREMQGLDAEHRFRTRKSEIYLNMKLHLARRDYTSAITAIKKSLTWFDDKDILQKPLFRILKNNLLRAYLFSGRKDEGIALGLRMLKNSALMPASQYATQELTMILALRSGKYQLAYVIYKQALEDGLVDSFGNNEKETFLIIEAYIHLLVELKLISIDDNEAEDAKLKIGRFVNSMIVSYKEKDRRNIHILIIKIIYQSIHGRDRDFDQSDAIRKYIQRHLNGKDTIRAKYFLSALVQWPENGYGKKIVKAKAEKYLRQLTRHPVGSEGQDAYGEIVPFEKMWYHLIEA